MTASRGGSCASVTGMGWKRLGPRKDEGETRSPQTGSVSTRSPPSSNSRVECPSHVALSPVSTGRAQVSSGLSVGKSPGGLRSSPPRKYSPIVEKVVPGLSPEPTPAVLPKNPSPNKRDADNPST